MVGAPHIVCMGSRPITTLAISGRQTYPTSAPHASIYPYPSRGNTNYLPSTHQMTAEAPQGELRCYSLVKSSKSLHSMVAAFPRLPIVDTTSQGFQPITTKAERGARGLHRHKVFRTSIDWETHYNMRGQGLDVPWMVSDDESIHCNYHHEQPTNPKYSGIPPPSRFFRE